MESTCIHNPDHSKSKKLKSGSQLLLSVWSIQWSELSWIPNNTSPEIYIKIDAIHASS
jgi:hypothetical protein